MKLKNHGKSTLGAEVEQISPYGIWLFVEGEEYFLSFKNFPWFRDAKISQVQKVYLIEKGHLHWPKLDVDLEVNSLKQPEKYPLIYH